MVMLYAVKSLEGKESGYAAIGRACKKKLITEHGGQQVVPHPTYHDMVIDLDHRIQFNDDDCEVCGVE